MKIIKIPMIVESLVFSAGVCKAEMLPYDQVGLPYKIVRVNLRKRSFVPDNIDLKQFSSSFMENVHKVYPEVVACAVDAFTPCVFGWSTKHGRYFTIGTRGSQVNDIKVVGLAKE